MDELVRWFRRQLEQTGTLFVWALEQVPMERREVSPPGRDEWTAARHAFHMMYYEREIALPSMRQWLGGAMPDPEMLDEDVAWVEWVVRHDWDEVIAAFQRGRAEQIALVERVDPAAWDEPRGETLWDRWAPEGGVTLRWAVTKMLQHTAEHTHDVLRLALMWDYSARKAGARAALPARDGR